MVMKEGRVVEIGASDTIFENPGHEYTRTLLSAVPGSGVEIEHMQTDTDVRRGVGTLMQLGPDHWVAGGNSEKTRA